MNVDDFHCFGYIADFRDFDDFDFFLPCDMIFGSRIPLEYKDNEVYSCV